MRLSLIVAFVFIPLLLAPSMASAHGKIVPAQAIEYDDAFVATAADAASAPELIHDGPCCGLPACTPLVLGTVDHAAPAMTHWLRQPPARGILPAGPFFPIPSPPG